MTSSQWRPVHRGCRGAAPPPKATHKKKVPLIVCGAPDTQVLWEALRHRNQVIAGKKIYRMAFRLPMERRALRSERSHSGIMCPVVISDWWVRRT